MSGPDSYDAWKAWAQAEDQRTGMDLWKREDRSNLYDYAVIRHRFDELASIRRAGDLRRLAFYLNEGIHGNMGGMGSPRLYGPARFGTKKLVTDYTAEIVAALEDVAAAEEIPLAEKRTLFLRARDCWGRSALMVSGAGSLGAFHVGVVKALAEHGLVPNVVSGASAGSIVTGVVGTHREADLPGLFTREGIASRFEALHAPGPIGRFRRERLRLEHLRELIETAIPDVTFGEAFEETGRRINVSVAPATAHQRSRLLNASTSPNAYLHEAILASCAIPGVFPPVTLAARDADGRRVPYISSRQWVDGSITDDQPARRLARLYGVNHFITSQANPIALWVAYDPRAGDSLLSRLGGVARTATREGLRTLYPYAMDTFRNWSPMAAYMRLGFAAMTQDYTADINIVLERRLFDPRIIIGLLSSEESEALVREGEHATWPRIEQIRICTQVGRAIDRLARQVENGGLAPVRELREG